MRIVHVSDCFPPMMGGIETQVSRLAQQEMEAGHQVIVLTCADDPEGREYPYPVLRSAVPNPWGAPLDPRAPRRFHDVITRFAPDVVHLHMGELTPIVQAMLPGLRRAAIPTVVTVHSVWNEKTTIPVWKLLRRLRPLPDERIVWTGVSNLVATRLQSIFGPNSVHVLRNGVDRDSWLAPRIPHHGLQAVYAARFSPRKRVADLVRMVGALPNPGNLRVVIAGEGPLWEHTRGLVDDLGLGDRIDLTGRLSTSELRQLYARSDVYLGPSVREASSLAGAEARSAGLALLTRSQSGLAEQIENGRAGVAVDSDQEFVLALQRWIDDPTQVQQIVDHNLATIPANDWRFVLPETMEFYRLAQSHVAQ